MASRLSTVLSRIDDKISIIRPRYEEWLEKHGDEPWPQWVADRIAELLVTRPRVRQGTFSASTSGTCLRAQELQFLGVPTTAARKVSAGLMNVYNDGKWRHMRWQGNLLAAGILDKIEVPTRWRAMNAAGSLDGEGVVPDDHPNTRWRGAVFGFELKGVNPFWYPRWVRHGKPQEHHLRQVHRYFLVTGNELFVIVYEDKGTNEWHEWVIKPNKQLLKESRQELEQLNRAIETQRLHEPLNSCRIRTGESWKKCSYAGVGGACELAMTWPPSSLLPPMNPVAATTNGSKRTRTIRKVTPL